MLFLTASLFGCCSLHAQQQGLFYYYKGNPVSLNLNSQHFLVYADAEKTTLEELEQEYKVTEWIENGENGILEAQVNIPNNNYDSILNVLKAKEHIVDVEPVIGDSEMINTSRLFYVKLYNAQDYTLLNNMALRTGSNIRGEVSYCENWYEMSVNKNSTGNSIETANQFWETGYFANIDPGFILRFEPTSASFCVSDPRFNEQWGMHAIKACSAWKITKGDNNVRIAVIDKGIDEHHREFDSTHVVFSYDMNTKTSPAHTYCEEIHLEEPDRGPDHPDEPSVCFYHGIHVGGIIYANHNRDSIAGVCPYAGLINISNSFKLRADTGTSRLAQAIKLSVMNGARIINNSWRVIKNHVSPAVSILLESAIDTALAHDCIVVFSAGNQSDSSVCYPANYRPELLTVGAVSTSLEKSSCSNYGSGLDVVAPGVDILSTHNNNGYYYMQGTSMAAPHVSGVAGLMFSINPGLTGQEVRNIIEQTAIKNPDYNTDTILANGSWCSFYGYGLVDAHRAVLKAAYHKVYGDTALTLCDTNHHIYTVHTPYYANIDSVTFLWNCSGNLHISAGQNSDSVWVKTSNGGIGQLQCHIIHDGDTVVSTLDIPIVSGRTVYDNMSLNNSVTFPDTFVLSREIVIDSLSGFTSQMDAYASAAGGADTDGADGDGAGVFDTPLQAMHQSLSETYYTAVRVLLADSVLDLNTLEQWHTAAQPIADPYSLTETRFMEGYAEPFVAETDDAELANYAEFHAMKLALRNGNLNDNADNMDNINSPGINWYALTLAQIAQLQTIADRNTGRASVMAKGVLCFFFGICYDDDLLVDNNLDNQDNAGKQATRTTKATRATRKLVAQRRCNKTGKPI